ncbi:hypothetical protein ACIQXG_19425 [Lysinibacillus sphaericus]|uniref:hypothetical protein n=1 Tax=Lysinibacillus sphaericus TaxID=1421 RepID=UPI0038057E77
MEQIELDLGVPIDESKLDPNPMVNVNGYGPEDKRCKHCKHLFARRYAGTYYKCGLRQNTNGAATDQRVNWKACSEYENREE